MASKARPMSKRQFRIGELATALEVEKYVIRFWEKEFGLRSTRSDGGQRFYTVDDLSTFARIKKLLYTEGFTIAGARQKLQEKEAPKNISPARTDTHQPLKNANSVDKTEYEAASKEIELWKKRFFELKDQLVEIKKQVLETR